MTRDPELNRILWTASQVLGTQGLRRGEKAIAERCILHITIRKELPSPANVEAVDEICDRILTRMRSRLAHFLMVERTARRALVGGAS